MANEIIIVRGNDTDFNGSNFLTINLETEILDLSTFKAKFYLGDVVQAFNDISSGTININLTAQQTSMLPMGRINGILNLIDSNNKIATIESIIPFKVISIVSGNAIATEPYTLNFDVKQGGETILNVSVESAVSVEVGTTTTLPSGSNATVTNVGTLNHLVLDFGIPQGIQGETGQDGADGQDATINGVNTLTLTAQDGLTLTQSDDVATISGATLESSIATKQDTLVSGTNIKTINNESILGSGNIDIQGGGGTSNYNNLNNKPQVNSVTLQGNKSLDDLGIQPKGNYALVSQIPDVSNFITKDVNDLTYYTTTTDLNSALASKQDVTDSNLNTTAQTIVGAINEVDSIALGANQALSYGNYSTMITAFNSLDDDVYRVGQNIYIITTDVPDLWISSVESTSVTYTYTTDSAFTTALATDGYVQVGYYKLSALETQKVDLTNYVDLTSAQTITGNKTFNGSIGVTSSIFYGAPRPSSDNSIDLGLVARRWKDFYIVGSLKDGTNSIAVNKIANKDNYVTLTQAEYEQLTPDADTYYFIEET